MDIIIQHNLEILGVTLIRTFEDTFVHFSSEERRFFFLSRLPHTICIDFSI